MRKWTISLTCLGLGGLGAMLLSERGRKALHIARKQCSTAPGRVAAWNEAARNELDHIIEAVNELEQSLPTHTV